MTTPHTSSPDDNRLLKLGFATLGVIYGDIGTSPLYALRECFLHGDHAMAVNTNNVLGILSLIFWTIMMVVSFKYVMFIMRMDNRGEGGELALITLVAREWRNHPNTVWFFTTIGLCGAALFYGDGIITPAISVLSAVEGLTIANPALKDYVVSISILILIGLFFIQHRGTGQVSRLFSPIMFIWFSVLAILGVVQIVQNPYVLAAVNPAYAVDFFFINQWVGFLTLGSVVLVVTGGEALYADMGHFGKKPIRLAWFSFVLPALLLNYFGQGALILAHPEAIENPFYNLVPSYFVYPMVLLATIATVIASQALITGVFSVTSQAIQLSFCPRLTIEHTSETERGQIYMPAINWVMLIAIIGVVLGFESSSNLAAAYGIAVTGTMLASNILAFVALYKRWPWHWSISLMLASIFMTIDLAFFSANALKFFHGGWFPIVIALSIFILMSTWRTGRKRLLNKINEESFPIDIFFESIQGSSPIRVEGTAVFMTSQREGIPSALLHNLKHNKVLHERVVFLTILSEEIPYSSPKERLEVSHLGNNFYVMTGKYGFMESPDVVELMSLAREFELDFDMMQTTFFLSREIPIPSHRRSLRFPRWREHLFISMLRNAKSATDFFHIPSNRVVEIGSQVHL